MRPPPTVAIRGATAAEADEVHRIMQLGFADLRGRLRPESGALRETVADVRAAIERGGAFLAFAGDDPVGCARYQLFPDHAYAERVAVLPAHRGRGIAVALMAAIEAAARARGATEARVNVRASLPANHRFYARLGYQEFAREPYPEDTDVSVSMLKRLE